MQGRAGKGLAFTDLTSAFTDVASALTDVTSVFTDITTASTDITSALTDVKESECGKRGSEQSIVDNYHRPLLRRRPTGLPSDRASMPRLLFSALLMLILSMAPRALAGNNLPAGERLKSCNPATAIAAAEEIVNNPAAQAEPAILFGAAETLFRNGRKDEGVFWFYAAQLRMRYQMAFENGDRGQIMEAFMMNMGPRINNYAFQNVPNFSRILDAVLAWDAKAPNPFRSRPHTPAIDQQIQKVYAGLRAMQAKVVADRVKTEASAQAEAPGIESLYARAEKADSMCGRGQVDPANADEMIRKEVSMLETFVSNNPKVIHEVGAVKRASQLSSNTRRGQTMPSEYMFYVTGNDGRTVSAFVGVTRTSGTPVVELTCVTHSQTYSSADPSCRK
jgi:hypothetical protein